MLVSLCDCGRDRASKRYAQSKGSIHRQTISAYLDSFPQWYTMPEMYSAKVSSVAGMASSGAASAVVSRRKRISTALRGTVAHGRAIRSGFRGQAHNPESTLSPLSMFECPGNLSSQLLSSTFHQSLTR